MEEKLKREKFQVVFQTSDKKRFAQVLYDIPGGKSGPVEGSNKFRVIVRDYRYDKRRNEWNAETNSLALMIDLEELKGKIKDKTDLTKIQNLNFTDGQKDYIYTLYFDPEGELLDDDFLNNLGDDSENDEKEEEEFRPYDMDAFAREINQNTPDTLTREDLELLKLLKFKERDSLQESDETPKRTEMNNFLALTNFNDLNKEQQLGIAKVLSKIDDKFIEKLKEALPGYKTAKSYSKKNKEFEDFVSKIRSKLVNDDYNKQLEQLQQGVPLFKEDESGMIVDIIDPFFDQKSIVRKFLKEKQYGNRTEYKKDIYPVFNAMKKQDPKLLKTKYDGVRAGQRNPLYAQKLLLNYMQEIINLLLN